MMVTPCKVFFTLFCIIYWSIRWPHTFLYNSMTPSKGFSGIFIIFNSNLVTPDNSWEFFKWNRGYFTLFLYNICWPQTNLRNFLHRQIVFVWNGCDYFFEANHCLFKCGRIMMTRKMLDFSQKIVLKEFSVVASKIYRVARVYLTIEIFLKSCFFDETLLFLMKNEWNAVNFSRNGSNLSEIEWFWVESTLFWVKFDPKSAGEQGGSSFLARKHIKSTHFA